MGKKPTKKNTKPMVVEIDDKPLLDTSNLDTSIAPASTSSNKKDNKKTATSTPTTTTEKEQPKSEKVENKNVPAASTTTTAPVQATPAAASTNVVIAPSIEAPITDDFSVVPEKNKNKKKVASQTEAKQNTVTSKIKKTGNVTRNQFHLLELDEDDIVTDDTHTHNYETPQQQQTKKSKKSKSSSSSTKSEAKKSTKSESSSSSSSTKVTAPAAPTKKEEKKVEPVKEQPKAVTEQPKAKKQSQSTQPQQNKKSEGVFYELINSIITPGVPTVVYKIIYFALIGVLLFSLVPLYYSGLNSMYMVGVVALVFGLGLTLTLFIQEFSRVKELKESKGSKKATSRKLK